MDKPEKRFKPLAESYEKITLALCFFTMYPNPNTERKRLPILLLLMGSFIPAYIMFFYDVFLCIMELDIENLTRQLSIGIPLFFAQLKLVLARVFKREHASIIDEIDNDYERYNDYGNDYRQLIERNQIKITKLQNTWGLLTFCTSFVFPIIAIVTMTQQYLNNDPQKVMVHELRTPIFEDYLFISPYYEILFVYMVYICAFLSGAFFAYDGLFFACIYHAHLKLEIVCFLLSKVFENPNDVSGAYKKLRDIVQLQNNAFKYVQKIQKTYEIWLMLVFLLTVMQICLCMMQAVSAKQQTGLDVRYIVVTVASIIQVFLPCHMASMIATEGMNVSSAAYCCGWESVKDPGLRKSILFIIARFQIPMEFTPMNIITFDMELFVFVLQKSYAVYTLMRPN